MIIGVCGIGCAEKYHFAKLLASKLGYSFLHFQNRTNVFEDSIDEYFCSSRSPIIEYLDKLQWLQDKTVIDYTPVDLLSELMSEISSNYVKRFGQKHEEGGKELLNSLLTLEKSLLNRSEACFSYFVHVQKAPSSDWTGLRYSHIDHLMTGYLSRLNVTAFYLFSERLKKAGEYADRLVEMFHEQSEAILDERRKTKAMLN